MATTDISWVNAVDTGTIVASSEAAALPSSNLLSTRYGRVWRSLSTTPYFTVTFAAVTTINVLALSMPANTYDPTLRVWTPNLASTDTVRHRLYDAAGSLLLDTTATASGVVDGYGLHVYLLSAPLAPKSWRCDISAPSRASLGFFDVKRAWAAPHWQPSYGISIPWDESWNDDADIIRGKRSGGLFVGDGPRYRSANLVLNWMSAADKIQAKEFGRVAGRRGQALIIPSEAGDIAREAILGHIDKIQPVRQAIKTYPPVYSQGFSIIQDL